MSDPQSSAPYLDAIAAYGSRGSGRMHVPGHKGGPGADPGLRAAIGERALLMDIPAGLYGVDLGVEITPQLRAEQLAAEAYGAQRSWFLTNGATQGNHALTLALAPPGSTVVVQRNSHASVVDGLVLSGGRPVFAAPEYDDQRGIAHTVEPATLDGVLTLAPEAQAAFVVSPTYFGVVADIPGLAEVAHRHGCALIVDQSWGPHFGFHPEVPQSALAQGADAVLTSTHKMAGSLTQSAILHVVDDTYVDVAAVDRAVRIVRSTSPSSLLLASLDAARRQMAVHGEALLERTVRGIVGLHADIAAADGLRHLGPDLAGSPGVHGLDPLKIAIDVRGTGATGYAVGQALGSWHDVHPELATDTTVLFVLGPAERPDDLTMGRPRPEAHRHPRDQRGRRRQPGIRRAADHRTARRADQRDRHPAARRLPRPRRSDSAGRRDRPHLSGVDRATRRAFRRCCRASGSRLRSSSISGPCCRPGARLHGAHDPTLETITIVR